jgi:predicted metal-binding membrane protein
VSLEFNKASLRPMNLVLAGIAIIVAVAWVYLLAGAGMPTMDMGGGKTMLMPPPAWSLGYAAITFAMWSIMMVAMMIPSATPPILRIASRVEGISTAAFFTIGYLIVWIGFSAVATMAQWVFDSAHVLSDSMAIRSGLFAGLIIVGAGLYQLSPIKQNCLRRCCSSKNLLADHETARPAVAMRAGMTYGASCFGCCWALMCLLFVVGIMNLFWIAAITVWVLREDSAMGSAHRARHRRRPDRLGQHRARDRGVLARDHFPPGKLSVKPPSTMMVCAVR